MQNQQRRLINAEAARLSTLFVGAGAMPVETACLQPADILLDLYGEDIRARAYVTHDAVLGEQVLRPDFTVPVVQMHMADGAEPARYTYNGPVWRKQQPGSKRAAEYVQVGFELFDGADPAAADAEVFALFVEVLRPFELRAATGDLGILMAAVAGLSTLRSRKSALMRHLWRPARFKQLLDRFGGLSERPKSQSTLLAAVAKSDVANLQRAAGGHVGLRTVAEIATRIEVLQADAAAKALSGGEVGLLTEILNLKEKSDVALARLRDLSKEMKGLTPAIDRLEQRLAALDRRGIDVAALDFEASYGRTTLEYYDGFVFGFYAEDRDDLPVVASGGRYDALTDVLGQGRSIPAVGGVIRPEFLLESET